MKVIENGKRVRFNVAAKGYYCTGLGTVIDSRIGNEDSDGILYQLSDVQFQGNLEEILDERQRLWVCDHELEELELEDYREYGRVTCTSGKLLLVDAKAVLSVTDYQKLMTGHSQTGYPLVSVVRRKNVPCGLVMCTPTSGVGYPVFCRQGELGQIRDIRIMLDM